MRGRLGRADKGRSGASRDRALSGYRVPLTPVAPPRSASC
ncbi:hypothetical protein GLA29479_2569 [Lysobacter antibioticus]|nr:hypothetical protein GLA29479_2569 [Lysobacter antibioticus]